jgi:hypothetical protein
VTPTATKTRSGVGIELDRASIGTGEIERLRVALTGIVGTVGFVSCYRE